MSNRHQQKKIRLQDRREEFIERIKPEMLRLSQDLHGGEYAPNAAEFQLFATEGLPNRYDLHSAFGKWENVVATCGLALAEPKYYWAKRQKRTEDLDVHVAYEVRDDTLLIAEYRPPVKVRKEDKDRMAQLCAGIADDKQRRRAWFTALGYPERFVEAVL